MTKRIRNLISILFITDDRKEPFSVRLPLLLFQILVVGFSAFVILVAFGAVSYYYMYTKLMSYDELEAKYARSLEMNQRVQYLMERMEQIETIDNQIRNILGTKLRLQSRTRNPASLTSSDLGSPAAGFAYSSPVRLSPSMMPVSAERSLSRTIPTVLPVEGIKTQDFHFQERSHDSRHLGIDIAAPENSLVRSGAEGFVIFAGWTSEWGQALILDHGNGFLTYYKHNNRLLVSAGDFVRQGASIALLGSSGHSTAPHLHYEIWKDGAPIDPTTMIIY